MIAVFFYNKTTRVPWTWLAPTVTGANLSTNTLVLNSATMTESVLPWWYTHPYNIDTEINYAFNFEPNNANFIYAFKESFLPARAGWGGGFSVNLSGVTGSISNLGKLVKDENDKLKDFITKENNDTNSHIEIAKGEIIDTIETIEMPENDMSDIIGWIGVLKARFTKLSEWLKTEQKKEMESKDKENEGKLSELQLKIDEMEEAFQEIQGLSKSEVKEKQKLIDEMEETAQEIIKELEKEKEVNKEATEKEIKDKIISSLSE